MYLTLYAYSETKAKATIFVDSSGTFSKVRAGGRPSSSYHYTNIRQLQNLKSCSCTREAVLPVKELKVKSGHKRSGIMSNKMWELVSQNV